VQQQDPVVVVKGNDASGFPQGWGRHAAQCDGSDPFDEVVPHAHGVQGTRQESGEYVGGVVRHALSFRSLAGTATGS